MREYGISELDGRRVLLAGHCDAPGCTEQIKPGPDVAKSGWTHRVQLTESGNRLEWDYCAEHSR